jgi:hypothetical protein
VRVWSEHLTLDSVGPCKVSKLCVSIIKHNKISIRKCLQITDPCRNDDRNDFKRFILDSSHLTWNRTHPSSRFVFVVDFCCTELTMNSCGRNNVITEDSGIRALTRSGAHENSHQWSHTTPSMVAHFIEGQTKFPGFVEIPKLITFFLMFEWYEKLLMPCLMNNDQYCTAKSKQWESEWGFASHPKNSLREMDQYFMNWIYSGKPWVLILIWFLPRNGIISMLCDSFDLA